MSSLHLVNKGNQSSDALNLCRTALALNDSVLFIQDGCYNVLPGELEVLIEAFPEVTFHVLEPDLRARGLLNRRHPSVIMVDYNGFVELTEQHNPVLSWY